MAVPTQQELYRPILEIALESGDRVSNAQIHDSLGKYIPDLSDADRQEKSGQKNLLKKRIRESLRQLIKDGLITSASLAKTKGQSARGPHQITDKGRGFLASLTPEHRVIDDSELPEQMPGKQSPSRYDSCEEQLEASYHQLQDELAAELLETLSGVSAAQFERLVVNLLETMGYGTGAAVGRSGDGGIDGIINQDRLGLEKIYVQAKLWTNRVGEPEIRNFSGSLDAQGASKGVFITTSHFHASATQTAESISKGSKLIRLVDGDELARLMIDHGVGVVTKSTYELKMLDENYFADI